VLLNGLGLPSDNWVGDLSPGNAEVLAAVAAHPDRLAGLGVIRLGDATPRDVQRLHDAGFIALKTTRPRAPYDDPAYDEVYGEAEALGLPILFHTGFIVPVAADRDDDVSSARCRPDSLDRIARTFPSLTIVMAHLGMPWHVEAAEMSRFHPNVYVDLSGALDGWRNRKSPSFFAERFYWPHAVRKIVFGSDVHHDDLAEALHDHRRILGLWGVSEEDVDGVLGLTAARLFDLRR
jgi:uncharacterized protein